MSILGYKIINLYKVKTAIGSSAEEYEADITDEKMQEIATALGCDLQIMTSGSKWLLYKGTNTDNGWLCQIVSNYFEVRRYLNGQAISTNTTGTNMQCRVMITNSSSIKNLSLRYSKARLVRHFLNLEPKKTQSYNIVYARHLLLGQTKR